MLQNTIPNPTKNSNGSHIIINHPPLPLIKEKMEPWLLSIRYEAEMLQSAHHIQDIYYVCNSVNQR